MNILSQPDSLSLSGNIKDFIISSSEVVRFRLYKGDVLLLDNQYSPNVHGNITIAVGDVIYGNLSAVLESGNSFLQNNLVGDFTAMIGETTVSFRALKCGVANLHTSASVFLTGNFLTWQPQVMEVRSSQPQWLTYYNAYTDDVTVVARYYRKNNTSADISLANIAPAECMTVNVQFSYIAGKIAEEWGGYYDVFVQNTAGEVLSYTQRYIFSQDTPDDKFFLFENSLGGIDCAVFTGENVLAPAVTYKNVQYDEAFECGSVDIERAYNQSTGYKTAREILWLKDFWPSKKRYTVDNGSVAPIVLNEQSISCSNMDQLNAFTFTYKLSEDRGFQNLPRVDTTGLNLEIATPDRLFFFSAPVI